MEQFTNLPGFFVDIADDGLQIMPTISLTDSVTLIGTAEDGPLFTPIRISRIEEAEQIFGAYHNNGISNGRTLVIGARQAYGAGCRDIRLVRIPHATKAFMTLKDAVDGDKLIISAANIGTKYNDIKIEVTEADIKVWNLTDAAVEPLGEPTFAFAYTAETTFEELVNAFNENKETTGVVLSLPEAVVKTDTVGTLTAVGPVTLGSTEGTAAVEFELGTYDGVEKDTIRYQLLQAYTYLMDYETSIVVPLDVAVKTQGDVVDPVDAEKLADFCAEANSRESRVIGVIAAEELGKYEPGDIAMLVTKLTGEQAPSNLYKGQNGQDIGKFISIVVAESIFYDGNLGMYSDKSAAAYAGLIASLPPHSATTNKVIPNVRGLRYNLHPSQLDVLTEARYVTFRNRSGRGTVVTDGITCARPLSDFQRLSTLRIANSVVNVVRQVTEPFIGEAMEESRLDAINTAIESGLRSLKDGKAVQDYRFVVYFASLQDRVSGILTIEIDIVPAFEVRKVRLKLTLKPTL